LKDELASILGDKFEPVERVPYEEMPSQLAEADVMLIPRLAHPALRVAMPTKFGEYLASGRPVIVSNVDETADLVRQHGCGLVAEPNPEGWAEALEQAAALSHDAIRDMGAEARRLAEKEFCWDSISGRYYKFLRGIVHG
jgi:glycosyltransferase involved in cell wall biosynthesis